MKMTKGNVTGEWYAQPIVKETISEYCKNRLVQLGSDPILRLQGDSTVPALEKKIILRHSQIEKIKH
jgi:hypothetical protein